MVSSREIIKEVSIDVLLPLKNMAKKDKVNISEPSSNGKFFASYDEEGNLVGCAGIIVKNNKGRIRSVFIKPEYRGKGYSSTLMSYIIKYMTDLHVCYIDQLSSQPEWWIKNGWKEKSKVKNGSWIFKTF